MPFPQPLYTPPTELAGESPTPTVEEPVPIKDEDLSPINGMGVEWGRWSGGQAQSMLDSDELEALEGLCCDNGITMRGGLISAAILWGEKVLNTHTFQRTVNPNPNRTAAHC